ncbi:MAG: hypothetical protein L6Q92_03700 [Phycisphaerae bacterium]|nr:hypothetical protein [Phycisphaerae bacterium]
MNTMVAAVTGWAGGRVSVSDKVMFEIYREADYARQYRVVYFTELDEHNKENEISRAMAGEHFIDGFIPDRCKDEAKQLLGEIVGRLNRGEAIAAAEVQRRLRERGLLAD